MSHPLDASRAKISEAHEKLGRLNKSIQRILDPGPYQTISEFDPNTRQNTVRVKRIADLPLIEWGVLIGGLAHDLRSALNYIVTALVLANHNIPGRQHEFPIFEDRTLYFERDKKGRPKRGSGPHKIEGVDPAAAALIESLQPYNGLAQTTIPTEFTYSALWAVHELNRVDKHQELIVPTPIVKSVEINIDSRFVIDEHIMSGPLEDDAVLVRWTDPKGISEPVALMGVKVPRSAGVVPFFPARDARVPVHAHFTFDVAFAQSGPTKGDLVLESLNGMCIKVAGAVEAFVPFFP